MSARVGTGGTSLRHRSEMLGRVYREASHQKTFVDIKRQSKTPKHMGGAPKYQEGFLERGVDSSWLEEGQKRLKVVQHTYTELGVQGGLQQAGKRIKNFDSKTNSKPLGDFKNQILKDYSGCCVEPA